MTDLSLILAIVALIAIVFLGLSGANEEVKLRDLERKVEEMERRINDLEKIRPEVNYTVLDHLEINELREEWLHFNLNRLASQGTVSFTDWIFKYRVQKTGKEASHG